MKKKIHVFHIHGGNTFTSERAYQKFLSTRPLSAKKRIRWNAEYLEKGLGSKFEVVSPRMPLQDNAKYRDWALTFKRYVPLLNKDFVLIGQSLGGIFLAKYLSENKLPRKALAVYLVCPPFDNDLPGDELAGGFTLKSSLSLIEKNAKRVRVMFSKDDYVVPVAHAEKYRKKLPGADIVIYKSKNGHFLIEKFPEIVRMIKADVQTKR